MISPPDVHVLRRILNMAATSVNFDLPLRALAKRSALGPSRSAFGCPNSALGEVYMRLAGPRSDK